MADTLYGLGQELRPYEPTWRDTLAGLLMGSDRASPERSSLVEGLIGSRGLGNTGVSAVDLTPAGPVFGLQEGIQNNDKIEAGLNLAAILAGGAPFAKAAAKAVRSEAASLPEILAYRTASLYNPPVKPPRAFELDYPAAKWPNGASTDGNGRLTHTIDGDPISARYVAGRIADGGGDVALSREALDEIAKAGTGEAIHPVPASTLRGDVGRVEVNKYSRMPERVEVAASLDPEKYARVSAHEIGHVIDQVAGELPTTAVMNELKGAYNTLSTGRERSTNLMGPQHVGYKDADVPRELWAELVRAYMADPNYAKSVAPKAAKALRKAVNTNPRLNKTIQFNSIGAPAAFWAMPGPDQDQQ